MDLTGRVPANESPDSVGTFNMYSFNRYGYIPGDGSVSGALRAAFSIINIARSIFDMAYSFCISDTHQSLYHAKEVCVWSAQLLRGCVEIVPLIGGVTTLIFDSYTDLEGIIPASCMGDDGEVVGVFSWEHRPLWKFDGW
jgi:hypothetical protein